mgnify:CR=1 FL=1
MGTWYFILGKEMDVWENMGQNFDIFLFLILFMLGVDYFKNWLENELWFIANINYEECGYRH